MADLTDLAREVVTLPGWRWMAGMACWCPGHVTAREGYRCGHVLCEADGSDEPNVPAMPGLTRVMRGGTAFDAPSWGWPALDSGWVPDLSDPATVGCVHALVEEACGGPVDVVWLSALPREGSLPPEPACCVARIWREGAGTIAAQGPTRVEALVALWREVKRG